MSRNTSIWANLVHAPSLRPKIEKAKMEPNLVCVDTPTLRLHYMEYKFIQLDEGSLFAATAVVVNYAKDRGVSRVGGVTAQIVYRNTSGNDLAHVTGAWLGEYEHSADFSPGGKHVLLILIHSDEDDTAAAVINDRNPLPHRARQYLKSLRDVNIQKIKEQNVDVEVTLLDYQGNSLSRFNLKYCRDDAGHFSLSRLQ